jgi:hypothetical protein
MQEVARVLVKTEIIDGLFINEGVLDYISLFNIQHALLIGSVRCKSERTDSREIASLIRIRTKCQYVTNLNNCRTSF